MINYSHNISNGTWKQNEGFFPIFKSVLTNHNFYFFYQNCFSNDFYFHFGFYCGSDSVFKCSHTQMETGKNHHSVSFDKPYGKL